MANDKVGLFKYSMEAYESQASMQDNIFMEYIFAAYKFTVVNDLHYKHECKTHCISDPIRSDICLCQCLNSH